MPPGLNLLGAGHAREGSLGAVPGHAGGERYRRGGRGPSLPIQLRQPLPGFRARDRAAPGWAKRGTTGADAPPRPQEINGDRATPTGRNHDDGPQHHPFYR